MGARRRNDRQDLQLTDASQRNRVETRRERVEHAPDHRVYDYFRRTTLRRVLGLDAGEMRDGGGMQVRGAADTGRRIEHALRLLLRVGDQLLERAEAVRGGHDHEARRYRHLTDAREILR